MECCLSLFALDCWPLFALDCSYRFAFTNAYGDTKLVHRLCHFLTTISRYAEPYSKRTFESEDSCRPDKCPWYILRNSIADRLLCFPCDHHTITIGSPVVLSHLQATICPELFAGRHSLQIFLIPMSSSTSSSVRWPRILLWKEFS